MIEVGVFLKNVPKSADKIRKKMWGCSSVLLRVWSSDPSFPASQIRICFITRALAIKVGKAPSGE